MDYLSKPIDKAIDLVVEVAIRQVGYTVNYKKNVEEVNNCVQELRVKKESVCHKVDEAKNNVREIDPEVIDWLKQVDAKIEDNEEFNKDKGHTKTNCSMGLLPYLWYRRRLGKRAANTFQDVQKLLDRRLDNIFYENLPSMDAALSNTGYERFESRIEVMKNIKESLNDPTIRTIGLWGPGGVGKTTLVKEVAKQVKEENLFNVVVLVSVSRNPNPSQIQGEIAYPLGLKFKELESEIERADRLSMRLKQEKENILIILDDLWEELDLKKLGISFDDDDSSQMTMADPKEKSSTNYKNWKILVTSRSREVLSVQMDVKTKSTFSMGLLGKEEAETLFKRIVGAVPDKDSDFENLVAEIMHKCGGLPTAIIAVGKALRNKSFYEWKEALQQLNKQGFTGVHKSMEFSIKLSYDHLESEELKSTFLLCAQMGPHPLVMDVVKNCFSLGIIEGVDTIKEARNRVDGLIQKLKGFGLLLDSDNTDYINMHDTVYDAALSIASKERNMYTSRNGKLRPVKDELERCIAFYLHNSDVLDELPEDIDFRQLTIFHVENDDPSMTMRIPDWIFKKMENLRVLVLIGIEIEGLPDSLRSLTKLRMLCLERCTLSQSLSAIGLLKSLRILSFAGSEVEKLPQEIGHLGKLQLLDISNCTKLRVIPRNAISSLTYLEELYMRNSLIQSEVETETNQSQIIVLDELRNLHKLNSIDICISNVAVMPMNLFFDKLEDYKIVIGDIKMLSFGDFSFRIPEKYEKTRALVLQLKAGNDIHCQKWIKLLFRRVEDLLLGELSGVHSAIYELDLEGFPCLRNLSIINNYDIQYIINPMKFKHSEIKAFPKLESVFLYKLQSLEILCHNRLTNDSLGNLKTIKVQICSQLKNLFPFNLVRLLTKLQTVEVSKCHSFKVIVVREDHGNPNKIEFPQLRSLILRDLPEFTGFYNNGEILSTYQSIEGDLPTSEMREITTEDDKHAHSLFTKQVVLPYLESLELSTINKIEKIWSGQPSSSFCFQNLVKLNVKQCNKLKYLFSFSIAKNLANLKGLFVSKCEMMEEIFIREEISKNEAPVSIFPKLEKIELLDMQKLRTIWHSYVTCLDSFSKLDSVTIRSCAELVTIFPIHMIGRYQNLISLEIFRCNSVEEIFDLKNTPVTDAEESKTNLQHLVIESLPKLKHVWNRDPKGILNSKKLKTIAVYDCPELKHLLPASVAKGLRNLTELTIYHCGVLEEIVYMEEGLETGSITFVFPRLISLSLSGVLKLRSFYRGRHTVECKALKKLKVTIEQVEETQNTQFNQNQHYSPLNITNTEFVATTEAFFNLEYVEVGPKEAKWFRDCINNYRMHNLREFCLRDMSSIDDIYWFLHRIPNLESLCLRYCQFNELMPYENMGAEEKMGNVVQLKNLWLWSLPSLKNIGLERDPVLQRVERLSLFNCPKLIKLAASFVSFIHLRYLNVSRCIKLKNLMTPSTARSLVQLTTMKVSTCFDMKEIVAREESEEETTIVIVFRKLTTLELEYLGDLTSFCSSKNLVFDFPSLEKLTMTGCPGMKIFTEGVTRAPKLQKVSVSGKEEGKWYWEGDLNTTIEKASEHAPNYVYAAAKMFLMAGLDAFTEDE